MPNSIDIFSFILALIILLFFFSIFSKLHNKDTFKKRLKDLTKYKESLLHANSSLKRAYERSEDATFPWFRKIINKIQRSDSDDQDNIKKTFDKAGIRSKNATLLYGSSKTLMVFLPALITGLIVFSFTNWNILFKILAIISAALTGSYLVDFILRQLVNARQERIRKAFPEALDLMVICTEAGLSLTATVQRVAREISQISPDMGYELALLSIELNMLPDRQKALQNFSDRMDAPYFKSIVSTLAQAEQYGTPIAQTMRTIAEQFRLDRLVEAEERAIKLPVLLSLPMMLFIFPCIYIVIIGPAAIQVIQTLK